MALTTIEGHLTRFIRSGEIPVSELVDPGKYELIESVIRERGIAAINPIKQQLPSDISYGEIRMVMADMEKETPGTQE